MISRISLVWLPFPAQIPFQTQIRASRGGPRLLPEGCPGGGSDPGFSLFWIDFDGFERSPDRWSQAPDSRVQRLPEVFQRCSTVDLGGQSGQKGAQ